MRRIVECQNLSLCKCDLCARLKFLEITFIRTRMHHTFMHERLPEGNIKEHLAEQCLMQCGENDGKSYIT